MTDSVTVRLLRFPVAVQFEASEHMDALQREFDLIRAGSEPGGAVPGRLLDLIDELNRTFGGVGDKPQQQIEEARSRGDASIDVVYELPPAAAEGARRLDLLLDEADAYCRAGTHLLTLATPAEALAFRKWFLGEVIAQIGGADPVAWPDFRPAPAEPAPLGAAPNASIASSVPAGWSVERNGDEATVVVDQELDLENASALRDVVQDLAAAGLTRLVLDLSTVTFLDSVGVSVLIASRRRLEAASTELRVLPSPPVRRTLTVSGVLDWLGAGD